jgi:hypothetical protein
MRLNSGEGNGASLAGRTTRNTARIGRTVRKVLISRYFLRTILPQGIDRQWIVTERHGKYRPPRNVEFCRSFIFYPVPAVGAAGTLTTFTGTLALCRSTKGVAEVISRR